MGCLSLDYSYGFNGQEKDDEVAGSGNIYTAEFWQYDSRLGRRWNQDPKPNPSISNYACFANNPIMYIDHKGDTITVTGDQAKLFLDDLNSRQKVQFAYNAKNQLVLANPDAEVVGVFATAMVNAINNTENIEFKTIANSDRVFIDAIHSAEVDVNDLHNLSGDIYLASILHFTVERFAVKTEIVRGEKKDYNKRKWVIQKDEFTAVHKKAHEAEAEYFKQAFPLLKDIKFVSEGYDQSSKVINEDGTYTINYVKDFGDVLKIYRQSFDKNGKDLRNIVPNESIVKPKI